MITDRDKFEAWFSKKHNLLDEDLKSHRSGYFTYITYQGKAKTDGGLIIPDQVRDREALATVVAYVMRLGPLAYKAPGKFGEKAEPWCQEGQWVCIGRYAGSRFKIDGGEVRIINDDEVIATILEPDDVQHV